MRVASLHLLGAMLGGAAVGGLLGALGSLLGLSSWRAVVIAIAVFWAVSLAMSQRPTRLGRQQQVPRRWATTMPPGRRYALWGVMLGSGVATPVVSSSLVVLLGAQTTAGPMLGALAGIVFGGTREAMALLPPVCRLDPGSTMALLPALRTKVQRLNAVAILAGGLLLVLASWS